MKRTLRPRVETLGLADVLAGTWQTVLPEALGRQGESTPAGTSARAETSKRIK